MIFNAECGIRNNKFTALLLFSVITAGLCFIMDKCLRNAVSYIRQHFFDRMILG